MSVPHFSEVHAARIEAVFSVDGQHRSLLRLPFLHRGSGKTLCVLGQNPSCANENHADKTVHYLERFAFERLPDVSQLLMLNLYSRIDTKKDKTAHPNDPECDLNLRRTILENNEFLMVFGELKNQGVYRFRDRAAELRQLFVGKTVNKIDIGTLYAPHPGNWKIHYSNFSFGVASYDFSELEPTNL